MNNSLPATGDEAVAESTGVPGAKSARERECRAHPIGRVRRFFLAGRRAVLTVRTWYYRRVLKMDLHPTCRFSLSTNLDHTNPRGVHIGAGTYLAFGSVVLAHDMCRLVHAHTRIGRNCFIGAHAIILPGVTVGDECIIGSGSVVTRDVPSHSIAAGNPARVIKSGIRTRHLGILADVYDERRAASAATQA